MSGGDAFAGPEGARRGVQALRLRAEPGEHPVPPMPYHLVGVHVGAPVLVHQRRARRSFRRRFVAGDTLVVPAGEDNWCAHSEPTDDLYLAVPPQQVTAIGAAVGGSAELVRGYGAPDPVVDHLVRGVAGELTTPGLGGELYLDALLDQLLVHLVRRYTPGASRHEPVSDDLAGSGLTSAIEYIHDNLASPMSLSDLADVAGVDTYRLSRQFKRRTGTSPHQYLLRARVDAARQLVTGSSLPLADIAVRVGFYDQSHLNRHLRRILGVTSAELRAGKNVPAR
ncbi:MAG: helix-turn-helix domain-containing protein [Phycicoccus sp.]